MSEEQGRLAAQEGSAARAGERRLAGYLWPGGLATVIVLSVVFRGSFQALQHYPQQLIIPLQSWIDLFFNWLAYNLDFGPFTFHDVTHSLATAAGGLIDFADVIFVDGLPEHGIAPLPWVSVTLAAGLLGHYVGGKRLALIGAGCFLYLAVFNMWHASMQTFALVIVTVPVAAVIGLGLGVLAARRRTAERLMMPVFNVMQSTPHFSYLAPVIMLFGFGAVPAMFATAIFAIPAMARNVLFGLQSVPPEIVEAARMTGCARHQLLWKVELPAARTIVMLGLNQVIMMTLAMVVIASLIGATGLGFELLNALQSLHLGKALQEGVAIVVIAVALDRISRGYAYLSYVHHAPDASFTERHPYMVWGSLLLLGSIVLAALVPAARILPGDLTVTTAPFWDKLVDYVTLHFYDFFIAIRSFLLLHFLIPFRNALLWLPYPAILAALALAGWSLGGARLALVVAGMSLFPAVTGLWEPAMITLYMIGAAVLVCVIIGFPLGAIASRHDRLATPLMLFCDTLQTFPSFIYLIPVIMVFKVGDVAAITAVIIYAIVPVIRYTNLSLRGVPQEVVEAARAAGATNRQLFWKVQMPLALPGIMLGLNQTVMMGLFMVAITSLIGTQDLGQEINRALSNAEVGRAVVAGLCVAAIGLVTDRFIATWAERRKQQLGLA